MHLPHVTRRRALVTLGSAGLALTGCASAPVVPGRRSEATQDAALTRALAPFVERGDVTGLVAGIRRGDEVRFAAIGKRTMGGGDVDRGTIFRVASMTKPVVAAAAMMLIDDGTLTLSAPVATWLPELADMKVLTKPDAPVDSTVPLARAITVRDVLTYTMGAGMMFTPTPLAKAFEEQGLGAIGPPQPAKPPPTDVWLQRFGALPLVHQPGEVWMYNTSGDVLGALVARAAKQPLDVLLRERVFLPLGMRDTAFFTTAADRFTASYAKLGDGPNQEFDAVGGQWSTPPAFPSGAGGLVSTVDDFLAFGQMLLAEGKTPARRLLTKESVREMTRDQLTAAQKQTPHWLPGFFEKTSWGYGLAVSLGAGPQGQSAGTFGWDGGLGTSWQADPTRGVTGVLLTNQAFTSPTPPPVVDAFWRAVYA